MSPAYYTCFTLVSVNEAFPFLRTSVCTFRVAVNSRDFCFSYCRSTPQGHNICSFRSLAVPKTERAGSMYEIHPLLASSILSQYVYTSSLAYPPRSPVIWSQCSETGMNVGDWASEIHNHCRKVRYALESTVSQGFIYPAGTTLHVSFSLVFRLVKGNRVLSMLTGITFASTVFRSWTVKCCNKPAGELRCQYRRGDARSGFILSI